MREIPSGLAAHLAQPLTSLATCLKIERRDGVVIGLTDHDGDLVVEGVTYRAGDGFSPTSVRSTDDLSVDRLEVEGSIGGADITEVDILAGKFDGAALTLFLVNYANPGDGTAILKRGSLGAVTQAGGKFTAELRGLSQALQAPACQSFSPTCRARFGDAQCGIDLALHGVSGTVDGLDGAQVILDAARTDAADAFAGGVLTFSDGPLAGQSFGVRGNATGRVVLLLPWAIPPEVGNGYVMHEGCDKRLATCVGRFNNALNFRGEPFLPGLDRVLQTPTTRVDL